MENPKHSIWSPSESLIRKSYVSSLMEKLKAKDRKSLWEISVKDLPGFWDTAMKDMGVEWYTPYSQVLDDSKGLPWCEWFVGGKTNLALNCVDRHQSGAQKNKIALLWEGDDGEVREFTYEAFGKAVNQAANGLKSLGVEAGDCVGILMPMVPEVVIQLFACFKVGAVAIPIFSGFGVEAIRGRLSESKAKVLFTSDIALRRGKPISVKETADASTDGLPHLAHRVVYRRGKDNCPWDDKKDIWWHEWMSKQSDTCETAKLSAEAKSMIIFTSGTTGKPKGAQHTHAGCLATVGKEMRYTFNVDSDSRFFWFTDIGWMMGPWEMIGVTMFGGTLMLFEGAPNYPTASRLWEVIERHKITHLGISPTAIRLLMKSGDEAVSPYSMSSLQMLGSTGETWDPQSYEWFFEKVGKRRCPIMNISGGTEIMGCLLTPLPLDELKPCSLGGPGLGVDLDIFDENGKPVRGQVGHLVCKQPIPSMTKSFLGNDERYLNTYFGRWEGVWYHGDWARVDDSGQWFLHGRSDDTMNIAGKRVGPNDFEAALMQHAAVAESAAIGVPDDLKGEACVCYVTLKPDHEPSESLRDELKATVINVVGKSLAPREIRFAEQLPKTRSAKIVRAMIRKVYLGEPLGDTGSVENTAALDAVRNAT